MNRFSRYTLLSFTLALALTGCGEAPQATDPEPQQVQQNPVTGGDSSGASSPSDTQGQKPDDKEPSNTETSKPSGDPKQPDQPNQPDAGQSPEHAGNDALQVVAQPESMTVLVNKQFSLPEGYHPDDLVYPDVPFIFKEKVEKRMLRKEAAEALEKLFAAAKEDGISLAGVSGYRSHETQKSLFNRYVKKDGLEKARMYSALPGTSEHETGLAIDVSGSTGKCAATDCFADTDEAKWLDEHAHEHGFIIRYPKDKDSITGYQYEPWHLRYVGVELSKELVEKGLTLEEYYDAVPVTNP